MFQTYLKIAWRNIWKNKGYSITNILGLAIGMCCTILILLWVHDEMNWDKFHPNYKQVYRVMVNRDFNGTINTEASIPFPLVHALKEHFPEVKRAALDDYGGDVVLKHNEIIISRPGINVSSDHAELFRWNFLKGSAATALQQPNSIVITASTAKALFGNEDPIGKIIRTNNNTDRAVTGVVADPPANSSIRFDVLTPFNMNDPWIKG
ncbi:MAG TPA: ABC transporter permease, partial [Chitinophagaceae bacterium]|nr:ABC transporter permease [Chitinophagaceae bacterium]